jgi:anaerobic C4-dicarboxylate transporter
MTTPSAIMLSECRYAELRDLFIVMPNVIMPNVVMLNVVMLSVAILNVLAPKTDPKVVIQKTFHAQLVITLCVWP